MACLQHKFVPHATLQRWLFCEFCGQAQELGAAAKKEPKQLVIKTADVDNAVSRYLEQKLAEAPEPQQEELFAPPGLDVSDMLLHRRKIEEAEARAQRAETYDDDMPAGFFDPNSPDGQPWTSVGNR